MSRGTSTVPPSRDSLTPDIGWSNNMADWFRLVPDFDGDTDVTHGDVLISVSFRLGVSVT